MLHAPRLPRLRKRKPTPEGQQGFSFYDNRCLTFSTFQNRPLGIIGLSAKRVPHGMICSATRLWIGLASDAISGHDVAHGSYHLDVACWVRSGGTLLDEPFLVARPRKKGSQGRLKIAACSRTTGSNYSTDHAIVVNTLIQLDFWQSVLQRHLQAKYTAGHLKNRSCQSTCSRLIPRDCSFRRTAFSSSS